MMETIETKSEYQIEVSAEDIDANTNQPVYVKIIDTLNNEYFGVWLSREESVQIARALLAAAGEPGATSKIVSNRVTVRPHVFEIGDDVETNDGIRGHIEDFQDATVIIRTDNELLVQRSIADIEYTGDVDAAEDAK